MTSRHGQPRTTAIDMPPTNTKTSLNAPTEFVQAGDNRYAHRWFGRASKYPLLCLQHFTGTLDNWDPAVTDALSSEREVILFDNAGVGRSSGKVPNTMADMAAHALSFLDALQIKHDGKGVVDQLPPEPEPEKLQGAVDLIL